MDNKTNGMEGMEWNGTGSVPMVLTVRSDIVASGFLARLSGFLLVLSGDRAFVRGHSGLEAGLVLAATRDARPMVLR